MTKFRRDGPRPTDEGAFLLMPGAAQARALRTKAPFHRSARACPSRSFADTKTARSPGFSVQVAALRGEPSAIRDRRALALR